MGRLYIYLHLPWELPSDPPFPGPPLGFSIHLEEAGWTSQGVRYNDRVIMSHSPCIYHGYLKTPVKPIYVGLFIGVKPFYKFDNDRRSFFGPVLLLWVPKIPRKIDNKHNKMKIPRNLWYII